jgi:L-alanine-DL-glutamate epimerase-like enolase superfamily enzyme
MRPSAITRVEVEPLDVPLHAPFSIASGAQHAAENLLVRVTLADGTTGLGEGAPFPAANGETRSAAIGSIEPARWVGRDARAWRARVEEVADCTGSARFALETALLDAMCRAARLPLWAFFGGKTTAVRTDVTITTGSVADAAAAAARWTSRGFDILKIKVGGADLAHDLARIRAVTTAAPAARIVLDGNAALDPAAAMALAATPGIILFEQPLARADLDGHAALARRLPCPLALDESVATAADLVAIARLGAARVVNLKPAKSGLVGCLDLAILARSLGLTPMIGAMVESRIALTASACLAAGLGGFGFVDLDTWLWFAHDPFTGGFAGAGPEMDLAGIATGHGVASTAR